MSQNTSVQCSFYGYRSSDYMKMMRDMLAPYCEVKSHVITEEEAYRVELAIVVEWNASSDTKGIISRMANPDGHVINVIEKGEEFTFVFHLDFQKASFWEEEDKEEEDEMASGQDFIADARAWHDEQMEECIIMKQELSHQEFKKWEQTQGPKTQREFEYDHYLRYGFRR